MWNLDNGGKVFMAGANAWTTATQMARQCSGFSADDEDEWVSDEPCSCYNCRYRRWTAQSFACMKG